MANPACIYCEREISDGLARLSLACHDCRHPLFGSWVAPTWWPTAAEDGALEASRDTTSEAS